MHTTYHINHLGQRQLDSDSDHPSLSVRSTTVKKFRIKIQPEEPPSYSAEHHDAGTFIRSSTAAYATKMRWSTIMGLQQPSRKHAAHDEDLRLFFFVCVCETSFLLFVCFMWMSALLRVPFMLAGEPKTRSCITRRKVFGGTGLFQELEIYHDTTTMLAEI